MLHLVRPTSHAWLPWALEHLDSIVLDHAHCEKKAASTALGLIFRYAQHAALMVPLARLAREELAHFEQMLATLDRRGQPFVRLTPSPYAGRLMAAVRTHEPARLVDTLICAALIEARSCERMGLLAAGLRAHEPELADLYAGLLASEARHHDTYLDLVRAAGVVSEAELRARLTELAAHEAAVVADAPWGEPRLHNGA